MRREERLATWITFLQAHGAMVEALGRELESRRGIPLLWYEVLLRLGTAPRGRMRMFDLSRSLFLSKSGGTRLVDRMQDAGLVARTPSSDDRRVTWAAITPEGARVLEAAAPVHLEAVETHFVAPLADEEIRTLRSALGKVLAAYGQPAAACHGPSELRAVVAVCGHPRARAPR